MLPRDAPAVPATPARLPHRPGLPLLGSLLDLERDRLGFFARLVDEVGPSASFNLGPRKLHVFSGPDEAQTILVDQHACFDKGPVLRSITRPFLGDGLLSSGQALHAQRRPIVNPAFATVRLHNRAAAMIDNAVALADAMASRRAPYAEPFDVDAALLRLSMQNAGWMLFSRDVIAQHAALGDALREAMTYVSRRVRNPLSPPLPVPTPANLRTRRALRAVDQFVYALLDRDDAAQAEDAHDVVSVLRAALGQGAISRTGARDELVTLFLAGVETVAASMSWTLYLLARHPQVRAAVVDEVRGAGPLDVAAVAQLPLLSACIDESMRLYPPAHSIGRRALADVEVGGFGVPRDGIVLLSLYAMHRRRDLWVDADTFKPERFLGGPRPRAYLPFGAGIRACIGRHMALLEAKLCLAALLGRVTLDLVRDEEVRCDTVITIRPAGGLWMRAH